MKPAETGEARERVYELFPVLGEKAQSPAGILSGGERQMLVIGRALMGNPSLLLLDEPFLGLSLAVRERILSVIDGELRGRMTILLAENDLGPALRILDRYCVLLDGERIHEAERSGSDTEERLRAAFRRLYRRDTEGGRSDERWGRREPSGTRPEEGNRPTARGTSSDAGGILPGTERVKGSGSGACAQGVLPRGRHESLTGLVLRRKPRLGDKGGGLLAPLGIAGGDDPGHTFLPRLHPER